MIDTGGYTWQNGPYIPFRITSAFHYVRHQAGQGGRIIKSAEWVLDYAITDNGRFRAGHTPCPWTARPAGSAHLYAPGTPYWEDVGRAPLPVVSSWVTFTGGDAVGLGGLVGSNGYCVFTDPDRELEQRLGRAADHAREQGDAGFWQAQGLLMEVTGLLLGSGRNGDGRVVSRQDAFSRPVSLAAAVQRYLRGRLGEKIRIQDIADHCNVSRSTLTHRYRAQTGETPWATLQVMRIDMARVLLMRGERLQTIAGLTGFSDEYHLSKTFKKVTGSAPRAFLKKGN